MTPDVIVIGGGIAGASAALTAAQLGARVLVLDAQSAQGGAHVTGAAMLAMHRELAVRYRPGGTEDAARLLAARTRKSARVHEWAASRQRELSEAGVEIVAEAGFIRTLGKVCTADGREWAAPWIVLATGSLPRRPSRFPFAHGIACDPETLLALPSLPRSLIVVGAEEDGCELASVYASLGTQVTLVERRRKLFRLADRDILEHVHRGLQRAGVAVALEDDLIDLKVEGQPSCRYAVARLASGRTEICDRIVLAAGRVPRLNGMIESSLGLAFDARGFVSVDENGRTSIEGLLAVGDLTGPPFRIGTAAHAARAALSYALVGAEVPIGDVPNAVHTIPQIAVVGVGEDPARLLGIEITVGRASHRDLTLRHRWSESVELLKLIFQNTSRELIGVQVVGGDADELIHLGAALLGSLPERIAALVVSHPSEAELFRRAAISALQQLGPSAAHVASPSAE